MKFLIEISDETVNSVESVTGASTAAQKLQDAINNYYHLPVDDKRFGVRVTRVEGLDGKYPLYGLLKNTQMANEAKYRETIARRGRDGNFIRLVEEVGEFARAIRNNDSANLLEEAADVLAWLMTNCSVHNIDLEAAYTAKYGRAECFRCGKTTCECRERSQ